LYHPGLLAAVLVISYMLAFACIHRVLMSYRTAQGAAAWIISLLTMAPLAVPLFFLFGRSRFDGYVKARRLGNQAVNHLVERFERQNAALSEPHRQPDTDELMALTRLAKQPFSTGNDCQLLRDGVATVDALLEAMEQSQEYILLEFYIVRSDHVGDRIKQVLKRKAAEGVRVYFLYDDIGSLFLSRGYMREMRKAGVETASFGDGDVRRHRLQINFRNHRKLLICDGRVGFVGGVNLGDEYLGTAMHHEPWRDTHCRIEGPAVVALQLAWTEDWHWATKAIPELNWSWSGPYPGELDVLSVATGPADDYDSGSLFFLNAINSARDRLWITTPYFVPDQQVVNALQLAALRGVDVRILIPEKSDSLLVTLAAYSYLIQASRSGISLYQYRQGFMHQKVLLVDNRYAAIGTHNLDNRSMRLNFEIAAVIRNSAFAGEVERMLEKDLENCHLLDAAHFYDRSLPFRLACRSARLLAPLL